MTLVLDTEVTLPFFHQPLLRALLYDWLDEQVPQHDGFSGLTFDPPETGYYHGRAVNETEKPDVDSTDWHQLRLKLNALYRFDPMVELLMDWVTAPVLFQGEIIQRHQGLPAGSPVSAMLAKIPLD